MFQKHTLQSPTNCFTKHKLGFSCCGIHSPPLTVAENLLGAFHHAVHVRPTKYISEIGVISKEEQRFFFSPLNQEES